jgi:hypothetical protein
MSLFTISPHSEYSFLRNESKSNILTAMGELNNYEALEEKKNNSRDRRGTAPFQNESAHLERRQV